MLLQTILNRFGTAARALALALLAGCSTPPSPYSHAENWVVRQNAVPVYFAAYDVIFVAPGAEPSATRRHGRVTAQTQPFGRGARVFAPVVRAASETEAVRETAEAIRFYLATYHPDGRPYVLVGAGESGARALAGALADLGTEVSPDDGLVVAYPPALPGAAAEAVAADARARVAAFLDWQRWKGWSKAAEAPPPEGASR